MIPYLNASNVLDYFMDYTNPFYDRTCSNEIIRMQRLGKEHLVDLTGIEYTLFYYHEPDLYIVKKQHKYSSTLVTSLAYYNIIRGVVYQAPDIASVIKCRISNCLSDLQETLDEVRRYSRFDTLKGYVWNHKDEEPSDAHEVSFLSLQKELELRPFRQGVDGVLKELTVRFPFAPLPVESTSKQTEAIQDKNNEPIKVKIEHDAAQVSSTKDHYQDLTKQEETSEEGLAVMEDSDETPDRSMSDLLKELQLSPDPSENG